MLENFQGYGCSPLNTRKRIPRISLTPPPLFRFPVSVPEGFLVAFLLLVQFIVTYLLLGMAKLSVYQLIMATILYPSRGYCSSAGYAP